MVATGIMATAHPKFLPDGKFSSCQNFLRKGIAGRD